MKQLMIVLACLFIAACDQSDEPAKADTAAATTITPVATEAPVGEYTLDKAHASLIFRVSHMGFSHFTGRFTSYDAALHFDPETPTAMRFDGTVNVNSLTLDNPPAGFLADLLGPSWFDADQFPTMSFHTTSVEMTGPATANVTGEFSMHGKVNPLTLAVTFNGGYRGFPMDPNARIGFSAHGVLKRSDYGLSYGIPAPGSNMGVSDEVELILEGEFTGPPIEK